MALIVVLWMLAVLSLFAASLGSQVRDRANQALVQRYLVQGRATGEAALFLALQQLQQQNVVLSGGQMVMSGLNSALVA